MTDPSALPPNLADALNAYKTGEPVDKCSAIAGVTRATFRKKVKAAGLPLRRRQRHHVDQAALNGAIDAYSNGRTVAECAAMCGIGRETFRQRLLERGTPVRDGTKSWQLRRLTTPPDLAARFLAGESVKSLARHYGISRGPICRMLTQLGLEPRDRASAMELRWQRASVEERHRMLDAAHEASRGSTVPDEAKIKTAQSKAGRTFSPHEMALYALVTQLGYEVELGVPCGKYNLDMVIAGTVAVEVFGGQWHERGNHRAIFAKRSRHVLDAGYSLAIVWVEARRFPLGVACAQHLATLTEITRGHPAIRRQHWVIRGDGYFLSVREDDGDKVPFVTMSGRREH